MISEAIIRRRLGDLKRLKRLQAERLERIRSQLLDKAELASYEKSYENEQVKYEIRIKTLEWVLQEKIT